MSETIIVPPDCELTVRRLWEYLDRTLDQEQMARIAAHIDECVHCRSHTAFEGTLIARIRSLRAEHENPGQLRTRVLAALRDAGLGAR